MSLHETRRLFNNFAFLTVGFFLTRLLTMLATLYATRALGPDAFGSLSFGLNIALVLSVFVNLGLDSYLVLGIARNPQESNALLGDAIIVKTAVFPLALLAVLFLSLYDPQSSLLFFIWMVYSLLHSYLILFWATFRGLERMEFQTLLMTGEAILLSVGEIVAVWLVRSATAASIAYLAATILAVIGGYALLYKMGIRPEYRWRPSAWKQLIKVALPFSLVFVYAITYDKLPSILIALLSGKRAAGWFNSVFNIMMVLTTIPSIVMSTVFPFLARKSQEAQQNAEEISTNLLKYITIISLGLAITLFVLAPVVVPFLFGDAYTPSIWILQVLAVGLPFLFLSITLINMIEAVGQQNICARYAGYALALAAPVCIFVVWQWGYPGGTLAYVINNAFLVVVMLWVARRTVGNIHLGQAFLAPLVAALGASVFAYLLRQWPFYLLLPLAALIYIGILVLDGAIGPVEVDTAHRLWQSRRRSRQANPIISSEPYTQETTQNKNTMTMVTENFERIDQIDPSEWNQLVAGRSFADWHWLQVTEALLSNFQPRYVLLRQNGRLRAGAVCSIHNRFHSRLLQSAIGWLPRHFPSLRCDVPIHFEMGLFFFDPDQFEELFPELLHGMETLFRQERISFYSFDHLSPVSSAWAFLQAQNYHRINHVGTEINLDIRWTSFDDYLKSLTKKEYEEYAQTRDSLDRQDITIGVADPLTEDMDELQQLVSNFVRHERIPSLYCNNLYRRAHALMGENFKLIVARQNGQAIGCVVMLRSVNDWIVKWPGLDYERTVDTGTYYGILAECIRQAVLAGGHQIRLGTATRQTIQNFGATVEKRLGAISVRNRPLHWLAGRILDITANPEPEDVQPSKNI